MSKTIQAKGELWLPQDKFDNRESSNLLEEGVEYNIIDSVGYATAKYVDDKVSTKTSVTVNGSNVATFDADTKQDKLYTESPIYINSSNSICLNYGTGLSIGGSSNDTLCVDWSSMPVDSSTFYIDNASGLQINSCNNLLDIGLHGSDYAQIYSSYSTLNVVGSNIEIDATSSNGQIAIQGTDNNIKIHNNNLGLIIDKDSNTLSIGSVSSGQLNLDYAYLQVESDGVSVSRSPTSNNHIANKTYVDDADNKKVDKSSIAYILYGNDANGAQTVIGYSADNIYPRNIPMRTSDGTLRASDPIAVTDLTTKKYVDGVTYNENILINGEFNVNQQGVTEYSMSSTNRKTVDMWIRGWGTGTFNANTKVLTNTGTSDNLVLQQAIEYYGYLWGKTLTYTVKIDGTTYSVTGTLPSSAPTAKTYYLNKNITLSSGYSAYIRLRYETSTTMLYADICLGPGGSGATKPSITLGFAKLEYGSVFTPLRRGGWNTYSDELIKCQRYYQNIYTHDVTSYARSTTSITISFRLPVMLRANPTLTERRTGTIVVGQGGSHAATKVAFAQMWSNIVRLTITTSGLVANQVYVTNSGDFSLDANIY